MASYTALYHDDCLAVMADMRDNSVDTILTDPPYGLNFMGRFWDHGVPGVPFWKHALRVAKPGASLLAFGGTRTYHRLAAAIEDAGWEIRDCLMWLYGSGFPKGIDVSKAIDKAYGSYRPVVGVATGARNGNGSNADYGAYGSHADGLYALTGPGSAEAELWQGWNSALKPAWEPVIVAMKPVEQGFAYNAIEHGVAGFNVDGARIPLASGEVIHAPQSDPEKRSGTVGTEFGWTQKAKDAFQEAQRYSVERANDLGRWPANLVIDEEVAELLDEQSGQRLSRGPSTSTKPSTVNAYGKYNRRSTVGHDDSGGASRFFYVAKASPQERQAGLEESTNIHPTVKPLSLMRYLCKLTATPTGGVVFDPFMGSGTTGVAAVLEGRSFVGVDINEEYHAIAERRIRHAEMTVQTEETGRLFHDLSTRQWD